MDDDDRERLEDVMGEIRECYTMKDSHELQGISVKAMNEITYLVDWTKISTEDLGLAYAFAARARRLKEPDDIRRQLGMCLGVLEDV